jgi:hypothetical protein
VISDLLDLFTQDPSIDQDETISLIKEITNLIKKTRQYLSCGIFSAASATTTA